MPTVVPGGEAAKSSWGCVRDLMWTLGNLHLDRQSYVLAVGGGAVLDMVGFAAAIVHRGLRLIRVPTTTLAQNDGGVGDCAEGVIATLGDGVSQNASETKVAVGSEYTDSKNFDVFTMTHPQLRVDYKFKVDGDTNVLDKAVTVDTAAQERFGWAYNTAGGTGTAHPRSRFWARYTADDTVTISRGYDGIAYVAWVQGVDFTGLNSYAQDGFESGDGTGGTGWSGNWSLSGEAAVTTEGTPFAGGYHLRLRSGDGEAVRTANLAGAANVRLQLRWKAEDFEADENATVEVYDGTWHTVLTVSDGQDDAAWHLADIDLSSYSMTSNFQVRIKSNMSDTSDLFYVDDLRIIENV